MGERTRGAAVNAAWGSGVDPTARLLDEVELPGDAYVGPGAVLQGPLVAGTDLKIQARALVGGPAQHRRVGSGRIVIGDSVRIRECATVHRGSPAGTGVTRLGDRLMLMAYAHVGHDARIGDDVTIANGAQLGGHVRIGSNANIGARAAVHQFVVVGAGAMVAAGAMVSGDVPPWTMVAGDRARVIGPNAVALRERWGHEGVDVVRRALRRLWPREGRGDVGVLEDLPDLPPIQDLRSFLTAERRRPVCRRGRS